MGQWISSLFLSCFCPSLFWPSEFCPICILSRLHRVLRLRDPFNSYYIISSVIKSNSLSKLSRLSRNLSMRRKKLRIFSQLCWKSGYEAAGIFWLASPAVPVGAECADYRVPCAKARGSSRSWSRSRGGASFPLGKFEWRTRRRRLIRLAEAGLRQIRQGKL